jgi:hypothetical protein
MAVRQKETRKSEGRGEAREERASGGRCAPKDGERDDFSPDDERGREADGVSTGVESRGGANLTFISGIVGFAPRGTLSRGGSRARDRDEYERGWPCRLRVYANFPEFFIRSGESGESGPFLPLPPALFNLGNYVWTLRKGCWEDRRTSATLIAMSGDDSST